MTLQQSPTPIHDPFAFLSSHQFIVLTTYRKDGTAVPTTVWFAYDQGKVYITTMRIAGKIKRIHNNGHVQMTPSDRIGNGLGLPSVQGQAHEAALHERASSHAILAHKYDERFERIVGPESNERTYIVVEPEPA